MIVQAACFVMHQPEYRSHIRLVKKITSQDITATALEQPHQLSQARLH